MVHLSRSLYDELHGYSINDLWEIVFEIASFVHLNKDYFIGDKTSAEFNSLIEILKDTSEAQLASFTSSILLLIKKLDERNNA